MKTNDRFIFAARNLALRAVFTAVLLFFSQLFGATQGAESENATHFQQGSYSGARLRGDTVTLKFADKGKFVLSDKDQKILVEGTYKVVKDQIEFTDENGPMAAKGAKPGKYKWKLDGTRLRLEKIEDEAHGRSKGLTNTDWTLEK
jgi:hypothetical protein